MEKEKRQRVADGKIAVEIKSHLSFNSHHLSRAPIKILIVRSSILTLTVCICTEFKLPLFITEAEYDILELWRSWPFASVDNTVRDLHTLWVKSDVLVDRWLHFCPLILFFALQFGQLITHYNKVTIVNSNYLITSSHPKWKTKNFHFVKYSFKSLTSFFKKYLVIYKKT